MDITKGKIGNALTSAAADHVVAVAADIYDETAQQYQSQINADDKAQMKALNDRIDSISGSSEGIFEIEYKTETL